MSLLKKVNETLTKASETGKNAAATLQLKNDIRKLEKDLESAYAQMGRAYENEDESELELWFSKVKDCKIAIKAKENEIFELEPKKPVCDVCGKEVDANAKFCGSCGAKIVQESVENNICKSCGQVNEATVKFCLNCGENLSLTEEKLTEEKLSEE